MEDHLKLLLKDTNKAIKTLEDNWTDLTFVATIIKGLRGTVFIAGNGGSASTASHFASDLNMKAGIKAICLNDNIPMMTAITNDYGWEYTIVNQLHHMRPKKGDMLIVISTKGGNYRNDIHSKNLLEAVDYMNGIDGYTVGISGADGGLFKDRCGYNIIVDSESVPVIESIHSLICHLIAWII